MSDYYSPTDQEATARRAALSDFDDWNRRALLSIFSLFGTPKSYLDVGCGSGAMTTCARGLCPDVVGVDVVATAPDTVHDLRTPLHLGRSFEIVTSIEVAEHLPEEDAVTFVQSIARHISDGVLVFTAALPGQPGHNHVNLKRPDYWRDLFYREGLQVNQEMTARLGLLWSHTTGPMWHLPANLQVFKR